MKIKVLSDNNAKEGFQSEHGLSFYIECEEKTILFDTGASDIYIKNAKKLGINIKDIDTIVLSHGHYDHGDGLRHLYNKKLICHPGCFKVRYKKNELSDIGLYLSREEIIENFILVETENAYKITKNIIFLGEIPRTNKFEAQTTDYITDRGIDDFVNDDSALTIISKKGLVIISGCSHSGICNIIEYAKKVTKCNNVYAVIGGFHLKSEYEQIMSTIKYFMKQRIQHVYPSHCTVEPALGMIHKVFGKNKVEAGMEIKFELDM